VFLRSLCKIEIQEVTAVWQCQENNDSVLLPSANYRHKYFGLKMTQKEQSWCQLTNELKRCEASKLKCGFDETGTYEQSILNKNMSKYVL
jgi:hypothetical protein